MKIDHIYPIADTMIDGKRVTVDLVLRFDGEKVHPSLSLDKGENCNDWLFVGWRKEEINAIRALGFPVDGIIEDKQPLELAEVKEEK